LPEYVAKLLAKYTSQKGENTFSRGYKNDSIQVGFQIQEERDK
jgi:hypothetical protein